ncbi:MAG: hypothetical protein CMM48_05035 [Rhodospirillaceae bacterium]|nr:hypothetical protein [Rhodospirillaceae bacterium]HAA90941.1 hypothetical protein [Rhodospirillaceae bacterium]
MTEPDTLLDPTAEIAPGLRPRTPPPADLAGKTVALLDISKSQGDIFLDQLETRLAADGIAAKRYIKPTNVSAAPETLIAEIAKDCDLVLEALSD